MSAYEEEALELIERALESFPDAPPPPRAFSAYGTALVGLDRHDEAEQMLLLAWDDARRAAWRERAGG